MILYRKLWNFDKLWKKLYGTNEKKLWYYTKLYLTIVIYILLYSFLLGVRFPCKWHRSH